VRQALVAAVFALVAGIDTPVALCGTAGGQPSREANLENEFRVRVGDPLQAMIVRKALAGAARRLRRTQCQSLFSEYRDAAGRPLTETLARLGVDAPQYLSWIYFKGDSSHCERDRLAVTVPGSRVVFLCARAFERANLPHAEYTLIHEMLHSLGLGENPPSSEEITERVRRLCAAPESAVRSTSDSSRRRVVP
jgi:hypothetical protein